MTSKLNASRASRAIAIMCVLALVTACGSQFSEAELAAKAGVTTEGQRDDSEGQDAGAVAGPTSDSSGSASELNPGGSIDGAGDAGQPGQPATGGAPQGSGPATGEPIRIGNICDCAGIPGQTLGRAPVTLQVWAKWLNARGGINGRPVEVVTANATSDPSKNLSLARDLVENRGVVAFVGNVDLLSASESIDYRVQKRIPTIGGDIVTSLWNTNPMFFPQGSAIERIAQGFAEVPVAQGHRKLAIFYCGEADFACGAAFRVVTDGGGAVRAGAEVVYSAQVSLAQPDFTAECLSAKRAGADAVVIISDPASVGRIVRSCSQQAYTPFYSVGSLSVSPSLEGNAELVGLQAPIQNAPWVATDTPAIQEYRQALAQYAPNVPVSPDGLVGWTSGQLFAKAAAAGGSGAITSESVLNGLWTLKNETLGGLTPPLTFVRDKPTAPSDCYFVVEMSADKKWIAPRGSQPKCG